jgi:hypothetical protein
LDIFCFFIACTGSKEPIMLPSFARTPLAAMALLVGGLVFVGACGRKTPPPPPRIAEYDFRGRTLAVVPVAPPHPEVLTGSALNVDPDDGLRSLLNVGTAIAREASAHRMRPRLDSASTRVDVSGRMAARTLEHSARQLRAVPVSEPSPEDVIDFELELRIRQYGIVASSWSEGAYFIIDGDMLLLDGASGRLIWRTTVQARDPVRTTSVYSNEHAVNEAVTAAALAGMSVEEIERALESLADFSADVMVRRLAATLDRVRR